VVPETGRGFQGVERKAKPENESMIGQAGYLPQRLKAAKKIGNNRRI